MANIIKIKRGSTVPSSTDLEHYELGYRTGTTELYINDGGTYRQLGGGDGDIEGVTAGTGLSGGGTSGTVTLNLDNHSASLITSGTLNNARLNTDMQLSAAAPRYKLQETGVTNTPVWWMIADGGNYSIRLNNTGDYPISINTDSDNDAITDIDINYDIHLKATKKLYLDGGSNTYISETSADNLKFYVGGVNLLSMIEGGTNVVKVGDETYLGVGDSTDFYMHHSTNSFMTNGTGRLQIRNTAQDQDIRFSVNDGGSTSNILTLNAASSRVGIGTTSPSYLLHLSGTAPELAFTDTDGTKTWRARAVTNNFHITETGAGDPFVIESGAGGNSLRVRTTGVSIPATKKLYFDGGSHTYISEDIDDRLRFFTGGAEFMRFTEDTTDQTQFYTNTRLGDNLKLGLGNSDDLNIFHTGSQAYIDIETGNLNFRDTGANTLAVIEQGGNVGIGETSIDANLHISGSPVVLKMDRVGTRAMRMGVPDNSSDFVFADSDDLKSNQRLELTGGGDVYVVNNLGVGTASPTYELDVAGDIGVDHVIYHNGDGNTYHQFTTDRQRFVVGSELLLDLFEGTQDYVKLGDGGDVDINLNDDMFVEGSSGNVGIGTTSPDTRLDVTAAGANGMIINQDTNDATNSSRVFFKNSTGTFSMYKVGGYLRVNSGATAGSSSGGTNLISIGSNVGIGTTSPSHKVHIDSAGDTNSCLRIDADDNRGANRYALDIVDDDTNSRGSVRVSTASGIGMVLEADPPKLQLTNTRNGSWTSGDEIAQINFHSNDGSGIGAHSVGFIKMITGTGSTSLGGEMTFGTGDYNTAATERMRIDEDGNVGIGTTNPSFSYTSGGKGLEIQDAGNVSLRLEKTSGSTNVLEISARGSDTLIYNVGTARNFRFGLGGTEEFRMDTSGNFHADADVIAFSTTTASDIKFKENVKSIPYGLKEVLQMNPVEFDWIEKRDGTHDIGFIAQEMEKIVPEVIKETETLEVGGTHKTMDYAKLTSILVQAIQEQQEQINKLKEQLNG